jgi:hypothetical protein
MFVVRSQIHLYMHISMHTHTQASIVKTKWLHAEVKILITGTILIKLSQEKSHIKLINL